MKRFGPRSRAALATADPGLAQAAEIVLQIKDHAILVGHRGQADQDAAAAAGFSEKRWPDGKHNGIPSLAIDVETYPRPASEQALREDQLYLLGLYAGVLHMLGYVCRTGADWDRDGEIADNGFDDFFHVEITGERL